MKVILKSSLIASVPNSSGIEGHGEGFCLDGMHFYYHKAGRFIPRQKVSYVKWEGNYAGRLHGEKYYQIVCFNKDGDLVIIDSCIQNPQREVKKYTGLTSADAIKRTIQREKEILEKSKEGPHCQCNAQILQLDNNQKDDECYSCFKKRQ